MMIVLNLHTCANKTVNDTISESSSTDVYRNSNESARLYSSSINKSDGDDLLHVNASKIDEEYSAAMKLLEKNNHIINTTIHYDEVVEPKEEPRKSWLTTVFSGKQPTLEIQEEANDIVTVEEVTKDSIETTTLENTTANKNEIPDMTTNSKYVCTAEDGVEICNSIEETAETEDVDNNNSDEVTRFDDELDIVDEHANIKLGFFGKLKEFFKRLIEKIKKMFHRK